MNQQRTRSSSKGHGSGTAPVRVSVTRQKPSSGGAPVHLPPKGASNSLEAVLPTDQPARDSMVENNKHKHRPKSMGTTESHLLKDKKEVKRSGSFQPKLPTPPKQTAFGRALDGLLGKNNAPPKQMSKGSAGSGTLPIKKPSAVMMPPNPHLPESDNHGPAALVPVLKPTALISTPMGPTTTALTNGTASKTTVTPNSAMAVSCGPPGPGGPGKPISLPAAAQYPPTDTSNSKSNMVPVPVKVLLSKETVKPVQNSLMMPPIPPPPKPVSTNKPALPKEIVIGKLPPSKSKKKTPKAPGDNSIQGQIAPLKPILNNDEDDTLDGIDDEMPELVLPKNVLDTDECEDPPVIGDADKKK